MCKIVDELLNYFYFLIIPAPVKVEEPPVNTTVTLNSNRDPDEVLQISDGPTKYSKREIISNWTKYELPVDNYDLVEESSHGADFEVSLQYCNLDAMSEKLLVTFA